MIVILQIGKKRREGEDPRIEREKTGKADELILHPADSYIGQIGCITTPGWSIRQYPQPNFRILGNGEDVPFQGRVVTASKCC